MGPRVALSGEGHQHDGVSTQSQHRTPSPTATQGGLLWPHLTSKDRTPRRAAGPPAGCPSLTSEGAGLDPHLLKTPHDSPETSKAQAPSARTVAGETGRPVPRVAQLLHFLSLSYQKLLPRLGEGPCRPRQGLPLPQRAAQGQQGRTVCGDRSRPRAPGSRASAEHISGAGNAIPWRVRLLETPGLSGL